jgi:quercetin dioxygenase-like cupin family protein
MKHISLDAVSEQGVSHNAAIHKRVLLQKGDVPGLIQFAQAQFEPGQVAAVHAHADMYEVFFVQSGQGTISVDGQTYVLKSGVCISVAPGETHEVSNTGNETLVLIYFGILG